MSEYNPLSFWNEHVAWFLQNKVVWDAQEQYLRYELGQIQFSLLDCVCSRVLEVGCGLGTNLLQLQGCGYRAGVDISKGILKQIERNVVNFNVLTCASWALPFKDNSFDIAFTRVALMHVPEEYIMQSISELKRVASQVIIIETVGSFNVDFCFNHNYMQIVRDLGFKPNTISFLPLAGNFNRLLMRVT